MVCSKVKSCLVIGAGIAGLTAARKLQAAGLEVTVLDKGRGVGGRLATRRIDDGVFDHGAQFVTVRSERFSAMMGEMLEKGAIYEWCRGIGTLAAPIEGDGHPRYQGTGGMTAIPKFLAKGLDVRIRHRVVHLKQVERKWEAHLEAGQVFTADALISTAPIPQALDLLDLGGYELPEADRAALDRIKYFRCLAVMALLDGPSGLPKPGAVREVDDSIAFLCDNRIKGISPDATAITIHASQQFSHEHWTVEEKHVVEWLTARAAPHLKSAILSASLHRWRYAQPIELHPAPFLRVAGEAPLLFAGDAFDGPRVEGAALSGMAAAEELLGMM
jgi:predicted NAD/FAD-dependent oxidoreductase